MNNRQLKKLADKAYREAYVNAILDQGIAHQIRTIRECRGWDQIDLAKKMGVRSQSAIARIEDPSYGKHSLATLKNVAKAFDVALMVKLIPFSRFMVEVESIKNNSMDVVSFESELPKLTTDVKRLTDLKVYTVPVSRHTPEDSTKSNYVTQFANVSNQSIRALALGEPQG